jgi:hypothetical protein
VYAVQSVYNKVSLAADKLLAISTLRVGGPVVDKSSERQRISA